MRGRKPTSGACRDSLEILQHVIDALRGVLSLTPQLRSVLLFRQIGRADRTSVTDEPHVEVLRVHTEAAVASAHL